MSEDFNANLSKDKVLKEYNKRHIGIGKEIDGRGRKRLENVFGILQTEGAVSESNNKVLCRISVDFILNLKVILQYLLNCTLDISVANRVTRFFYH